MSNSNTPTSPTPKLGNKPPSLTQNKASEKKQQTCRKLFIEIKKSELGLSREQILSLLHTNEEKAIVKDCIQILVKTNKIMAVKNKEGTVVFVEKKGVEEGKEETVADTIDAKLKGLSMEQLNLYKVIESVGRDGIWTRSLQGKTKLKGALFTKHIKILVAHKLIKTFKSITSRRKKFFILNNLQPAEHHLGGIWYNADLDFDREFVDILTEQSFHHIREKGYSTADDIREWITQTGIAKIQIKSDDMRQLLDTLKFDGDIESFKNPQKAGELAYKSTRIPLPKNGFTQVPCGKCPVFNLCGEEGAITPEKCVYMNDWLKMF